MPVPAEPARGRHELLDFGRREMLSGAAVAVPDAGRWRGLSRLQWLDAVGGRLVSVRHAAWGPLDSPDYSCFRESSGLTACPIFGRSIAIGQAAALRVGALGERQFAGRASG